MDGFDLGAARRRKGVTQAELAERSGLRVPDLVAIENDRVRLTSDQLTEILTRITEIADEKAAGKSVAA